MTEEAHLPGCSGGVLEAVLCVGPAGSELVEPGGLARWLFSSAVLRARELDCVVEEEYGYRRHLRWEVLDQVPARRLVLRARRAQRAWDGSDGTPVGPPSAAQRWDEPALQGTKLDIAIRQDVAHVRWGGFPPDADDDLRRQGSLLRFACDRALEAGLARPATQVQATQGVAERPWFADAPLLVARPGRRWTLQQAGGRVLLSVGDRRLVASCSLPGSASVDAMLDARLERLRGGAATMHVTLQCVSPDGADSARRWLASAAPELAKGTSIEVPEA